MYKEYSKKTGEVKNKKWCIFESIICPFANNQDGCFECKAKTDSEMVCKNK